MKIPTKHQKRPKAAASPTSRSIQLLKQLGYTVEVVERWNSFARIRHDLFGIGDLLAFTPKIRGTLMIQATSGPNHNARVVKIKNSPITLPWLIARNRLQIHSWGGYPLGKRRITCFFLTLDNTLGMREIDLPNQDLEYPGNDDMDIT